MICRTFFRFKWKKPKKEIHILIIMKGFRFKETFYSYEILKIKNKNFQFLF